MKLRVAVCDDQPEVLESMKTILKETGLVSTVACYDNIRELREELQEGKMVDLLMMDICHELDSHMAIADQKKNGIDFAYELNQQFPFLQIIYITGYNDRYSQDIFLKPVRLAGFLTKPIQQDYVIKLLLLVQEKQKEEAYWNRPSFGIVYNAAFVHGSHLIFPDCVFRVGVDLFCNFLSQLCCFPIKYNFPILKPNKPLGKLPGKFQIMTVHQNGHTFCLMNASQELKNLPPSHRVQRSDRFICQQNTWVTHQGSCNGSTLFLTAGKVFHWLLCLVKKSYPVQKLQSFRFAIFSIKPQHTGEKSKVRKAGGEHIFQAGGILHKTKILINGSNGCLKAALLPAVQRLEGDSIQKNLSAGAGEHSV